MSERKSWDIQPKRRAAQVPSPAAPAPTFAPRVTPKPQKPPKPPKVKKPARVRRDEFVEATAKVTSRSGLPENRERATHNRERESLKDRRKRARRRTGWIVFTLFILLIAAVVGIFWIPFLRIQHVEAAGPDTDGMQSIATTTLAGTYYYVFPRNSFFFFPEDSIRQQILSEYPDISAVSISRASLDSIGIISIPREAALTWCGETYTPGVSLTPASAVAATDASTGTTTVASSSPTNNSISPAANTPTCYSADANGVIFAPISGNVTPSSETLTIYGPLASPNSTALATTTPLGSVIAESDMIPNALQFVKAMKSLGAPIVTLVLRGDEADLYTQEGTRITYVLGQEHDAAQLAESAFPSLSVGDGSLEYIDLRFEGKVYYKKVGDGSEGSSTPAAN